LQNQLNQKDTTLQQQINSYEADVTAFEQKLTNFKFKINQINQSGGAGTNVYNSLITQQNELHAEGDSLNTRASQLNLSTHDYNSQVQNLKQNINQFNQVITQKPEEGLYNRNDNTITIYFADNRQELIHTLAHEFGHTLGMQHTDDPQSIMYPNISSFLSVTSQDKQQLATVCREQLLPDLWLQEFATWLHSTISSFIPS
jgi:chaperonin cofactor prefoldin